MGIYIDMEMPKDKAVAVVIHPDGTAYTAEMVAGVCTEYLADCTAVHVPPHGRLGDLDALAEEDNRQYNECRKDNGLDDACHRSIQWMLSSAPTIIQAEEGE